MDISFNCHSATTVYLQSGLTDGVRDTAFRLLECSADISRDALDRLIGQYNSAIAEITAALDSDAAEFFAGAVQPLDGNAALSDIATAAAMSSKVADLVHNRDLFAVHHRSVVAAAAAQIAELDAEDAEPAGLPAAFESSTGNYL